VEAVRVTLSSLLASCESRGQLKPSDVGVVTPYKAQEKLLRTVLASIGGALGEVEVATIDSFQGREKEVIVLSCVRANDVGRLGFLADDKRINVALTRARRGLIVLGEASTLTRKEGSWCKFCAWAEAHAVATHLEPIRAVLH